MTGNDHFCEVFFDDVRVPADNLVGELNGSFRQVMRQMEHERGGIDRLLSNRKLYVDVLPHADTTDPRVRQEIAAIETGLPDRAPAGAARGAGPGAEAVLGRHQDVLHRARAADRRRSAPPSLGPAAMLAEPGLPQRVSRNVGYAPAYTIMGGTTQILRNILGERMLGLPR